MIGSALAILGTINNLATLSRRIWLNRKLVKILKKYETLLNSISILKINEKIINYNSIFTKKIWLKNLVSNWRKYLVLITTIKRNSGNYVTIFVLEKSPVNSLIMSTTEVFKQHAVLIHHSHILVVSDWRAQHDSNATVMLYFKNKIKWK